MNDKVAIYARHNVYHFRANSRSILAIICGANDDTAFPIRHSTVNIMRGVRTIQFSRCGTDVLYIVVAKAAG